MDKLDIASRLDQKAVEFLKLFDEKTAKMLDGKFYFAGGCIYSLANDKPVKDYDIFLMNSDLIPHLQALDLWQYITEYALTYGKFQIVIKYYGEPGECVGQFDFRHNMHYYIPFGGEVESANDDDLDDDYDHFGYIHTNELIFNESRARDIEGVLLRIDKFVKRGMTISKATKKAIKKRTTTKAVNAYKKSRAKHAHQRKEHY
jgi:hypothetical protein